MSKHKLTLKELQSLLGSVNFVCKAVRPGCAFLRRLCDLTSGIQKPHHCVFIIISSGTQADILAWQQFLMLFHVPDEVWHSNGNMHLYTDASSKVGFGAFFDSSWIQCQWPNQIPSLKLSIAFFGTFPNHLITPFVRQQSPG